MITIKIRKSKFMPDEYSAFISFPYNQELIDYIKGYRYRSWIKGSKEWEIQIQDLASLLYDFNDFDFDISGTYVDISTPKEFITADSFNFKTACFKHQIEGFEYGMNNDKWLLGDEMGLGKTKQVIDIAVARKENLGYKHCLIICGVNGLKWNWYNEVLKHSDETPYILGQRVKKRTGELYIGSNKDKVKDLKSLGSNTNYFIITNVESLRDNDIAHEMERQIADDEIQMIAADEVHKMKNPASQQGKEFIRLNAKCKIAMTGTPLMNTPLDLYIILRWLGYEKHSFYSFRNYYAEMGGYGGYEIVGYKHLDDLEEQLQSIMLRRLKKDVLDLPEKIYVDEYVEMLAKQALVYKDVKAEIKSNIDMISISPNPLAEMIRMRQATGYTGILSSEIQCSAKLDRMEELVEDALQNDNQIVIFSNWTQMTDVIIERLEKYSPLKITGDTPETLRMSNVDDFQKGNRKIIVGTIGAMGTGLTLTAGSVIIFLDHPWSRALYEQAVDRCHRVGQKNNITIYNLMCENTIDVKIWNLVNEKGEMSDMIVDGKIAVSNKKELIEYLLE